MCARNNIMKFHTRLLCRIAHVSTKVSFRGKFLTKDICSSQELSFTYLLKEILRMQQGYVQEN